MANTVENTFNKISRNESKKLKVLETEKNFDDKKLKLKKIIVNSKDKRNYISFRDDESLSKNTRKFRKYYDKQNVLSHEYFNSTYSNNNTRNITKTNNDNFFENIKGKKLEDKINYLKKTILKNINHNIINNIQKIQNNTTPK